MWCAWQKMCLCVFACVCAPVRQAARGQADWASHKYLTQQNPHKVNVLAGGQCIYSSSMDTESQYTLDVWINTTGSTEGEGSCRSKNGTIKEIKISADDFGCTLHFGPLNMQWPCEGTLVTLQENQILGWSPQLKERNTIYSQGLRKNCVRWYLVGIPGNTVGLYS
jgi:hypothetical protein